ncbi:MAG TPA: YHS domain-containing protein [Desulfuromonadaceae bacterium]|jgi:YHS domain-containing protein
MEKNTLSEKIVDRLKQHQQELAGKQQQTDSNMKQMLEQREQQGIIVGQAVESIILPRMEELARQFDNAKVEVLHTEAVFSCVCEFTHTPRFPATVRFAIALFPASDSITARYDLNILPVLMEYQRNAEETFPLVGNENALAIWVEDKILDFVDTYLRLETHPLYQKDNTVVDIVCGMRIPSTAATSTLERNGRIFYFCSEHCKEAFIKESDK